MIPVSIITEGLGGQPFHSRVVLLVDESTTGAGERIAAFAQERKLAPVVGARTAGRLICCSVYKVGHGYFVRILRQGLVHPGAASFWKRRAWSPTTLSLTDIRTPQMSNSIMQLMWVRSL